MNNTGIILSLAYPDTIVRISDEKLVPYLKYINVGCENYVRAGHAALVLIEIESGRLEYFDFGRYTCPLGYGRVRGKVTDNELDFPLTAEIKDGQLINVNEILTFLATHPDLTHGEGKLVASVCNAINYEKARTYIMELQLNDFVRYGAFIKKGSNCSRFVTDTLIASITIKEKKNKLIKSKRFTPSTVGNVVIADTEQLVYEVSESGIISEFKSTPKAENRRCFLDKLKGFEPNLIGNIKPKYVSGIADHAQWLEGIGAGAWFELNETEKTSEFNYKRISPKGNIDVNDIFRIVESGFNYREGYKFIHYSNCKFFHIEQAGSIYRFERKLV
jgi:hypothetical protein